MDVATITRKVRRLFGDSVDEIIIQQEDIYDWVNEAQLKIVRDTHCLTKTAAAPAGTFPIGLPPDWIITKRVTYNGLPLKNIAIDDLDSLGVDPTKNNSNPDYYYIFAKQLRLYPDPLTADLVSVSHDYVCLPTEIAAVGTALDIPVSYHEDIVRFCIMRAHERNENWNAVAISQVAFDANAGNREEEASLQDDSFFVVRDDPEEAWY